MLTAFDAVNSGLVFESGTYLDPQLGKETIFNAAIPVIYKPAADSLDEESPENVRNAVFSRFMYMLISATPLRDLITTTLVCGTEANSNGVTMFPNICPGLQTILFTRLMEHRNPESLSRIPVMEMDFKTLADDVDFALLAKRSPRGMQNLRSVREMLGLDLHMVFLPEKQVTMGSCFYLKRRKKFRDLESARHQKKGSLEMDTAGGIVSGSPPYDQSLTPEDNVKNQYETMFYVKMTGIRKLPQRKEKQNGSEGSEEDSPVGAKESSVKLVFIFQVVDRYVKFRNNKCVWYFTRKIKPKDVIELEYVNPDSSNGVGAADDIGLFLLPERKEIDGDREVYLFSRHENCYAGQETPLGLSQYYDKSRAKGILDQARARNARAGANCKNLVKPSDKFKTSKIAVASRANKAFSIAQNERISARTESLNTFVAFRRSLRSRFGKTDIINCKSLSWAKDNLIPSLLNSIQVQLQPVGARILREVKQNNGNLSPSHTMNTVLGAVYWFIKSRQKNMRGRTGAGDNTSLNKVLPGIGGNYHAEKDVKLVLGNLEILLDESSNLELIPRTNQNDVPYPILFRSVLEEWACIARKMFNQNSFFLNFQNCKDFSKYFFSHSSCSVSAREECMDWDILFDRSGGRGSCHVQISSF